MAVRSPCCICFDTFENLDAGARCCPVGADSERHFICHGCLCALVTAECHPAGQFETEQIVGDIASIAGSLPCPLFVARQCTSSAMQDGDIMRAISAPPADRGAITAYLGSHGRVAAARAAEEAAHVEAQQQRAAENETELDRLRRSVEELCTAGATLFCPHCRRPAIKNDACMHMDTCPCGGRWCYCCGRISGDDPGQCPRGSGCDANRCYIEANAGWNEFALPNQTAGAGARDEFHRRRVAYFLRTLKQRTDPRLWQNLRDTCPELIQDVPTGRRISWDELDDAEMPTFGNTTAQDLPEPPQPTLNFDRSVSFVDTDGDASTIKLVGNQMSWHDTLTDECFLRPIARLRYRAADATIIAPEREDLLVARLATPAAGPERDELLTTLADMMTQANVVAEGFGSRLEVRFVDTDGDASTIKLVGNQMSWHDTSTDECFLRPIARLRYRASDAAIIAPERENLLTSRLATPAVGPQRDELLATLVDMMTQAGVEAEGFRTCLQVSFVDTEADASTIKLVGNQLSWHDTLTGECFLQPIARLRYREGDAAIIAPEREDFLTARLATPAPGPERNALLTTLVDMATKAGVELEGLPIGLATQVRVDLEVRFVDTEGDASTIKLVGDQMSWHDTTTDVCFLRPIRSLQYREFDAAIIAPELAQVLTARLVTPAAGPGRTALLASIVDMAMRAGVSLAGFP